MESAIYYQQMPNPYYSQSATTIIIQMANQVYIRTKENRQDECRGKSINTQINNSQIHLTSNIHETPLHWDLPLTTTTCKSYKHCTRTWLKSKYWPIQGGVCLGKWRHFQKFNKFNDSFINKLYCEAHFSKLAP